ncbi:MAG: LTA synthase family protein [Chitinophagaceae bacterium]|nr:MAG: LTA synthase family protein [Chitinophagaceae bacterium]
MKQLAVTEKKALLFLLKLLLLLCLLKCIFFAYNYSLTGGWSLNNYQNITAIIGWSLLYDAVTLAAVNLPYFILLLAFNKRNVNRFAQSAMAAAFATINAFVVALNCIDIFYFRFHLQRSDADLLYVLRNPFLEGNLVVFLLIVVSLVSIILLGRVLYKGLITITNKSVQGRTFILTNAVLAVTIILFLATGTKKILPTYPLTAVDAIQLPLTQNSFHTFIYSLYRKNDVVIPAKQYMTEAARKALFSIDKKIDGVASPKNIVLFIMESVPADFFDSSSAYKVQMPFLDSLVRSSTYFSNAFSYSYNSNKGITAMLAGIPTLTDIPLYHSNFTSINKTGIGEALQKNNYSSSFFIGDHYDDFGFAKCSKWLGIQQYHSMEAIPGYKQMEQHSMGLHDEYVLGFMQEKLKTMPQPFFAAQYNISTHYPNDLPKNFKVNGANTTPPMKTMQYYNDCLQTFFKEAALQPWFDNSVFIFCSDHWAQPHTKVIKLDAVESFRIPLFIYEPGNPTGKIEDAPVSQLDILNTVLHYGGITDSIVSYGENLTNSPLNPQRTVYTKINGFLYQAINMEYVLGFDALQGKALYCYNYKKDAGKNVNLLLASSHPEVDQLIQQMKAFLQAGVRHYRHKD